MKKGFSIVEVLMSLALAGVLLTLSLPAFNVVRNKHLHAKYQAALYATQIAIQQISMVYYKLDLIDTNNELIANLDSFDLQNRTEAQWDALNVHDVEKFNVYPLEEGTQNFCTQFANVINTVPFLDNGDEYRCDSSNDGADDLNFVTTSGLQFYGVNQPFPGGSDNSIIIQVILDDKELADSTEDQNLFKIKVSANGEVEPVSADAQHLTLVSYKIVSVDPRDETALRDKLVSMKGYTTDYATEVIRSHHTVETLIPYDTYLAEKTQLESVLGSGREIVLAKYYYKPKLTDFAF